MLGAGRFGLGQFRPVWARGGHGGHESGILGPKDGCFGSQDPSMAFNAGGNQQTTTSAQMICSIQQCPVQAAHSMQAFPDLHTRVTPYPAFTLTLTLATPGSPLL